MPHPENEFDLILIKDAFAHLFYCYQALLTLPQLAPEARYASDVASHLMLCGELFSSLVNGWDYDRPCTTDEMSDMLRAVLSGVEELLADRGLNNA